MRKIGIIGAGQTGRGFLARLLHGQAEIVFADRDQSLVDRLNAQGEYEIRFFGGAREPMTISGFRAYGLQDAAEPLAGCDCVLISVRAEHSREAGEWLAVNGMKDMPVVVCENAVLPAALVDGIGLKAASGAIFCTTVAEERLDIGSENYPHLFVSSENMPECLRDMDGFKPEKNFNILMKRKLYTYNAASGIIAFMGQSRGFADYADAANDPGINRALDAFYREINRAICLEFGSEAAEQEAFSALSKAKFQNRSITDTVARNAASPLRKLGAQERIMEPMRLILKHGGNADVLADTAACALRFAGAHTAEDAAEILKTASGLDAADPRFGLILNAL